MLKWIHRQCEKYLSRQMYLFITQKKKDHGGWWFRVVSRVEFKLRMYLYPKSRSGF